ncbi:unnamed protein product [Sympodiomycopsis kandeliae]
MTDYTQQAKQWLEQDPDPRARATLQSYLDDNDTKALAQAFGDRLAFGTAGLRGVLGVGPNNMNRLLVRQATAGLGQYIVANPSKTVSLPTAVVIAYDGRHGSFEFANDAAGVLAAMGLQVRLYDTVAPTPLGAFAVKSLGTAAGIVVTASHNPPEFNGYKVYQAGGTQINTPVDGLIADQIHRVAQQDQAPKCISVQEAQQQGLLTYLSEETFGEYANAVVSYFDTIDPSSDELARRGALRIAYTPLHGVGAPHAEKILSKAGFQQVWTVKQQREPDGDFPTVKFPNPEEDGAMDLVHALADEHQAHIAIANDPDADRLSVSARDAQGKIKQLSGDQIGAILGDELLRRNKGRSSNCVLSTIVSSRLLARLAQEDGPSSQHRETLTGFKWLGAVAQQRASDFLFAYEEALGYMVTSLVWDKDGLSAALLLSLLASELQSKGETLWTRLESIHKRVGLSVTFPRTIRLAPGVSGDGIMKKLRDNLPLEIGARKVLVTDDLLTHSSSGSEPADEGIPKNDVLRFYLSDLDSTSTTASKKEIKLTQPRVIIRPSGTEPKVKIYCESKIEKLADGREYTDEITRLAEELAQIADGFVELCK